MQTRLHPAESRIRKLSGEIPARFIAFDVLVWDGVPLWEQPFAERRAALERDAAAFVALPVGRPTPRRATAWLRRARGARPRRRRREAARPAGRAGRARRRRQGEAGAHRRLRRRRRALEVEARRDRDAAPRPLRDDGEIDYVGSAAVAASRHAAIAEQVLPLLDETSDRRFSEPNRWGGSGLEEQPLRPELVAEVRYDKVQGTAVPARHEAAAVPAGQGSRASARGRELRPPASPAG